jgi:hypothetical protein
MDLGRRGNVPHEDARGTYLRHEWKVIVLIHPSINGGFSPTKQSCINRKQ